MNGIHKTYASYNDLKLNIFRTTMFRPKVKNYRMESFSSDVFVCLFVFSFQLSIGCFLSFFVARILQQKLTQFV